MGAEEKKENETMLQEDSVEEKKESEMEQVD